MALQVNELELNSAVNEEEFQNSLYCSTCDVNMTIDEIDVKFTEGKEQVVLRGSCYMPMCENTGVASVVPTTETGKRAVLPVQ